MQAKHDRPEGRGSSALGLAFLQMQNAAKRTIASAAPSPFHPRAPVRFAKSVFHQTIFHEHRHARSLAGVRFDIHTRFGPKIAPQSLVDILHGNAEPL